MGCDGGNFMKNIESVRGIGGVIEYLDVLEFHEEY